MMKQRLQLRGLDCVACAATIDGALEDLCGVQSASTSYARQWVEVVFDEQIVSIADLVLAIQAEGYEAVPPSAE